MRVSGPNITTNLRVWKPLSSYLQGEKIKYEASTPLGNHLYYLEVKSNFTSGSIFDISNFKVVNPYNYLSSSYNQAISLNQPLLPGDGLNFINQNEIFYNSTDGIVNTPDFIQFEGAVEEWPLILDNQYMNININVHNNYRSDFERNFRNENVSQKFVSVRPLLLDGEAKIKVTVRNPTVNFYDSGTYNNKVHKFRVVSTILPITFVTAPDTVGSTYVEYNLPNVQDSFYVFRFYKDGLTSKMVRGPLNTEI